MRLLFWAIPVLLFAAMTGQALHAQEDRSQEDLRAEMAQRIQEMPDDLKEFYGRAEGCQHWAGEVGDNDEERNKEIDDAMTGLRCNDLDGDRQKLVDQYKDDQKAAEILQYIDKNYIQ